MIYVKTYNGDTLIFYTLPSNVIDEIRRNIVEHIKQLDPQFDESNLESISFQPLRSHAVVKSIQNTFLSYSNKYAMFVARYSVQVDETRKEYRLAKGLVVFDQGMFSPSKEVEVSVFGFGIDTFGNNTEALFIRKDSSTASMKKDVRVELGEYKHYAFIYPSKRVQA